MPDHACADPVELDIALTGMEIILRLREAGAETPFPRLAARVSLSGSAPVDGYQP
jgi:hypothetical protein